MRWLPEGENVLRIWVLRLLAPLYLRLSAKPLHSSSLSSCLPSLAVAQGGALRFCRQRSMPASDPAGCPELVKLPAWLARVSPEQCQICKA